MSRRFIPQQSPSTNWQRKNSTTSTTVSQTNQPKTQSPKVETKPINESIKTPTQTKEVKETKPIQKETKIKEEKEIIPPKESKPIQTQSNEKKEIKETFYYPYAGCTDSHTYLSFLKNSFQRQINRYLLFTYSKKYSIIYISLIIKGKII